MFYNILDKKRKDILPLLKSLKRDFYLAGGTALALQIGHRDSIDFDFFCDVNIDTEELFERLKEIFAEHNVQKIQEEKNTLAIIVDNDIKISFFTYRYPLLKPKIDEEYIELASVEDIACMKLSAIVSRSTQKDYIDLYFVLQNHKLSQLLEMTNDKFTNLDTNLIIKSLTYFDDMVEEPIMFKNDKSISFEQVKVFLSNCVRKYLNK